MIWALWAGLILTAFLAYYAIAKHHIRAQARLETREIELDAWVKLALPKVPFAWQCPRCGMPALTIEAVRDHLDPDTSPCAYLQERQAAAEIMAHEEPPRPPEVSVSAATNARPVTWPAIGDHPEPGEAQ